MACALNMFVLSLTLLATITGGSRQFDALDRKINALQDMMEVKIEMIKQDFAMVVKNLSMSVIGEMQGTNGNVNTHQIANTMGEDPKNNIQAAEDVYKVIQRGFSSEKMALGKSLSRIEQSVALVQRQLENFSGDLTSLQTNFMTIVNDLKMDLAQNFASVMKKPETLTQLQLINAEISRNKNDIEAKVEKAKHDAILKSNEDCKTSNIKFNGELNSLQTNFLKIVNDIKKDVADINGRVMNKSETLTQLQLINAEFSRNKNDIEAKVEKAKQDAILKSNDNCKISIIKAVFPTHYTYGKSLYFRVGSAMDFAEGFQRCRQYGAHLPHLTTSEENAFFFRSFAGRELIGMIDQNSDRQWKWEYTGQKVVFTDWDAGEPNGYGKENCVEINSNGKWNDIQCSEKKHVMCEIDNW